MSISVQNLDLISFHRDLKAKLTFDEPLYSDHGVKKFKEDMDCFCKFSGIDCVCFVYQQRPRLGSAVVSNIEANIKRIDRSAPPRATDPRPEVILAPIRPRSGDTRLDVNDGGELEDSLLPPDFLGFIWDVNGNVYLCDLLDGSLKDGPSWVSGIANSTSRMNIEEFKELQASFPPSLDKFLELFQLVNEKQVTILKELQNQEGKVDNKLKSMKMGGRLIKVLFVGICGTVFIGSVVAAAVGAAPTLAATLSAVSSIPVGSIGMWVVSLLKKYENQYKDKWEMIRGMEGANSVVLYDLDNIKVFLDKLGVVMKDMLAKVDFAIREEEQQAVEVVVDEMENTMNVYTETIKDLTTSLENYLRDVRAAIIGILEEIIKHFGA